jgi:hypothetical protein
MKKDYIKIKNKKYTTERRHALGGQTRRLPHSSRATQPSRQFPLTAHRIAPQDKPKSATINKPHPSGPNPDQTVIPQFDSFLPWVGVGTTTTTATAAGASAVSPTSPEAGARGRSARRDGWCSPAATRRKSSPADSSASARRRSSSSATASAGILACAWCFPSTR